MAFDTVAFYPVAFDTVENSPNKPDVDLQSQVAGFNATRFDRPAFQRDKRTH